MVVVGLTAFAPAPFPRPRRAAAPEITVAALQGRWRLVAVSGATEGKFVPIGTGVTGVRITETDWAFLRGDVPSRVVRLAIDPRTNPAQLTFYNLEGGGVVGVGLIRRHEAGVQVLYC